VCDFVVLAVHCHKIVYENRQMLVGESRLRVAQLPNRAYLPYHNMQVGTDVTLVQEEVGSLEGQGTRKGGVEAQVCKQAISCGYLKHESISYDTQSEKKNNKVPTNGDTRIHQVAFQRNNPTS